MATRCDRPVLDYDPNSGRIATDSVREIQAYIEAHACACSGS